MIIQQPHDWDQVLALHAQIKRGEALSLTEEVSCLLRRVAPELAISDEDARSALLTPPGAVMLVREMRRRIFDGSRRLGAALLEAYRLQEQGGTMDARKVLEEVLAVEVVPLYRHIAQRELARLR